MKYSLSYRLCGGVICECQDYWVRCRGVNPFFLRTEKNYALTEFDWQRCKIREFVSEYMENFPNAKKVDIRNQVFDFNCKTLPEFSRYEVISDCEIVSSPPSTHSTFSQEIHSSPLSSLDTTFHSISSSGTEITEIESSSSSVSQLFSSTGKEITDLISSSSPTEKSTFSMGISTSVSTLEEKISSSTKEKFTSETSSPLPEFSDFSEDTSPFTSTSPLSDLSSKIPWTSFTSLTVDTSTQGTYFPSLSPTNEVNENKSNENVVIILSVLGITVCLSVGIIILIFCYIKWKKKQKQVHAFKYQFSNPIYRNISIELEDWNCLSNQIVPDDDERMSALDAVMEDDPDSEIEEEEDGDEMD